MFRISSLSHYPTSGARAQRLTVATIGLLITAISAAALAMGVVPHG